MVAVTRTFTVSRPLATVAEYLAEFANTREWDPGTVSCVRLDEGPIRVGSRWVNTSRFLGSTTVLRYRLVLREPDRLVFEGRNKSATSRDDLRLSTVVGESAGDDRTRIDYHAEITFSSRLLRTADPLLRRPFERLADRVAARMPDMIEDL